MSEKLIITSTDYYKRRIKRLIKKYPSLAQEARVLEEKLTENPTLGDRITENCYKIRLAISSKGRGKSGGARVITYFLLQDNTLYLLDIYDKSEQEDLSLEIIKIFKE